MKNAWLLLGCALLVVTWYAQAGYELKLRSDRPEQLYQVGETATLTPEPTRDAQPESSGSVEYEWRQDDLAIVAQGKQDISAPISITAAVPGFLRCRARWMIDGKVVAETMATIGFDVETIMPGGKEPEDFDVFWQNGLAELAEIPPDVHAEIASDLPSDKFYIYRISFANIDNTRIYGFYGVPKEHTGKLPAVVAIPGAGPGVPDPRGYFVDGTLSMLLNVHPFEAVADQNQLDAINRQTYGETDYCLIGKESPDRFYFRRVFLGFYRAIDWLTLQPEFDGKNLGITGSSQGGGSSLVMAGLCPKISYVVANVPAFCDLGSQAVGRVPGWPGLSMKFPNDPAILRTGSYFDAAFFARRIHCPVVILVGYNDTICNPGGVYATFNALATQDKRIVPKVDMAHWWPLEYDDEYRKSMMTYFSRNQ